MNLSIKQTTALDYLEDSSTNEVLFGGGAGGGKSVLGCVWILVSAFKYKKTRWLIGRSELKTLRETTLVTFLETCERFGLKANEQYKLNNQTNQIECDNGSVILLKDLYQYPADPSFDSLGSLEITGAFIDECNQITSKAYNIVKSRIRYKLDKNNLIPKLLLTCNPAKNWVYSDFYKPFRENTLPRQKKFVQSLIDDNPEISRFYKQNLLSLDKVSRERLLYGNWEYDDDPGALMNYESILAAFDVREYPKAERFISADIARLGRDTTVIGIWEGLCCIRIIRIEKNKVNEAAEIIKHYAKKFGIRTDNVIVDEDGVGGGVVDLLQCKGFVNNSRPLNDENYNNLKSQCYFKLAKIVNSGELQIRTSDPAIQQAIVEELEQVKQKDIDKDGRLSIIPKDKVKEMIGRSPDLSDMLAMRMYFELQPVKTIFVF